MKSIFKETYAREREISAAYDAAETAKDEAGMDAARKDMRALWDGLEANGNGCARLYSEYREAMERGNDYIDLHDVIWDKDVPDLIACMRENGVERFTFSSTWSSAVETAWLFQENGCMLEGLIQINGDRNVFRDREFKKIPAYLFRVE